MKKVFLSCLILLFTSSAHAFWGENLPYLIQLVENSVKQLKELQQIVGNSHDNLEIMREINRGINESLELYRTIYPDADPGIYKDWTRLQEGLDKLQTLYGIVVPSPEYQIQHDTDLGALEAIALNNSIYDYSRKIDEIGNKIEVYSQQASPGRASQLTAQSVGVMLHVLNESLRAQASGLKLQAQNLALQNHKEKELTKHFLKNSQALATSMKTETATFELPRF